MRFFVFVGIVVLCVTPVLPQEAKTWRGLKPGLSTPADAERIFGKPKKNRAEKPKFDLAVPAAAKEQMNFRSLTYGKVDDLSNLILLFLNEKLFGIALYPKNKTIAAVDISSQYDSAFLFFEAFPKGVDLSQFEGQKETTVPKVYPVIYHMLSVQKDRIIVATINNNSWKTIWRDGIKKPTIEMFPGYVESIQIFSREMEKK